MDALTCYAENRTIRRIQLQDAERLVLSPFAKGFAIHHDVGGTPRGRIDAASLAQLLLRLMQSRLQLQRGARRRWCGWRWWRRMMVVRMMMMVGGSVGSTASDAAEECRLRGVGRLGGGARADVIAGGRRVVAVSCGCVMRSFPSFHGCVCAASASCVYFDCTRVSLYLILIFS